MRCGRSYARGVSIELVETLPEVEVQAPFYGERVTEAEGRWKRGRNHQDVK